MDGIECSVARWNRVAWIPRLKKVKVRIERFSIAPIQPGLCFPGHQFSCLPYPTGLVKTDRKTRFLCRDSNTIMVCFVGRHPLLCENAREFLVIEIVFRVSSIRDFSRLKSVFFSFLNNKHQLSPLVQAYSKTIQSSVISTPFSQLQRATIRYSSINTKLKQLDWTTIVTQFCIKIVTSWDDRRSC